MTKLSMKYFKKITFKKKDLSNQGVPDAKKQTLLFQQSLCPCSCLFTLFSDQWLCTQVLSTYIVYGYDKTCTVEWHTISCENPYARSKI